MEDLRKLTEDGWNAYYAHDIEAVLATYTDDAELVMPGAPPMMGKDTIRMVWQMYMDAFPDEKPVEIRHFVDGDTSITQWRSEATHTGPLMMPSGEMLAPTGRRVSTSGVTVQETRGGRIVRQVFYFDNMEFLKQLGLLPEPVGAGSAAQ